MQFRKKNKSDELRRRRTDVPVGSRTTQFTYHSVRSSSDTNTGRSNRDTQFEIANKPKPKWRRRTLTYTLAIIVIGVIIYALTLSTAPKVVIIGQSNQTIMQPSSAYEQAAQKLFSSSLQNRIKILVNTDKLADTLESQFPELNGVSIIIPLLGHTPTLEIRPSQSILLLSNPQGQFVINQQGNAVLKLSSSVSNKFSLPVVTDDTGFKVVLGQEALSTTSVTFIKTIIDQFAAKNVSIQSMTLSTTPYELDVRVGGKPYYIKFNLLADPLYSAGTYFATVKLFTASNPAPTQYIDIRIPGRAYYK